MSLAMASTNQSASQPRSARMGVEGAWSSLKLALDGRDLILPRAPRVREEEVEVVAGLEAQLRGQRVVQEADGARRLARPARCRPLRR